MKEQDIQKLRLDYTQHSLDITDIDKNPFNQFRKWFKEALAASVMEPNACALGTINGDNHPTTRIILLKGLDDDLFKFYTNYKSDKGRDIENNNRVSMCFFWKEVERQVRINGIAKKLSRSESEAYFKSRPHKSQIGAHTSKQSREVPNRAFLDDEFERMIAQFSEGEVPLPKNWGGYGITPTYFEFWQGRPSRLHDRIVYEQVEKDWILKRLSP